jgi:hypothetical protein
MDLIGAEIAPKEAESYEPCSICLHSFEKMAILDSCMHSFCLNCIKKWAKISNKCPLCKTIFTNAIHSIESSQIYQNYIFKPLITQQQTPTASQSRFSTRTRWREIEPSNYAQQQDGLNQRKRVYTFKLRAKHIGTSSLSKIRIFSPAYFTTYPEKLNKLTPWIRRELSVILQDINFEIILEYILAVMKR